MKQFFSGPALATFAAAAVMNVSAVLAAQTSITAVSYTHLTLPTIVGV